MSEELPPRGPVLRRPPDAPRQEYDWVGIGRTPEFRELVHRRRSFVAPATAFFLCWYMAFIVLTALAPDFMSERIYEGLTVGYTLALTQFVMVLVLGIWYLRKADREFDPLAERVVQRAQGGAPPEEPPVDREGRHRRIPGGRGRPQEPARPEPRP